MSKQSNHSHVMAEVFAPKLNPDAHLLSHFELKRLSKRSIMLKSYTYIHTYIQFHLSKHGPIIIYIIIIAFTYVLSMGL